MAGKQEGQGREGKRREGEGEGKELLRSSMGVAADLSPPFRPGWLVPCLFSWLISV